MSFDRIILFVMDSVGIGELPDAGDYGDRGCNTLGNIAKACGGINISHLCALGLGKVTGVNYLNVPERITGCYGRMAEVSKGKDTITGHWEIAGIQMDKPFPTYPKGFPPEIIDAFKESTGLGILGNYAASGTEIIKDLGEEHIKTGRPIIYTSADSVFQIAAHEEAFGLERLYKVCSISRGILTGEHSVGRVVARPFTGPPGSFARTANRRDFSLEPIADTVLDALVKSGLEVAAVGKIEDIFSGRGITVSRHTKNNMHGVDTTLSFMREIGKGLIFTNLVDFDMLYGHRNDAEGYKKALEEFDGRIPEIIFNMRENDLLIITADHGCDPVFPGTDHTREYVPLLLYGKNMRHNVSLGTRSSFTDIACTISEVFRLECGFRGQSFLESITVATATKNGPVQEK